MNLIMGKLQGVVLLLLSTCGYLDSDNQTHPHNYFNLRSEIYSQECFDLQVDKLLREVTASVQQQRALSVVQRAVEDALKTVWPECRVKLFGSLSTGLGAATSDVDLAVFLPNGYNDDDIARARTTFESSPETYQNIHTRTRLPAITFHFAPLHVTCDVHFRNEGSFESELLHYLLSLDDRALKLAIIVKHWAKLNNLINPKYLTSYGMMMLVIFNLQQRDILPSIVELQSGCSPLILKTINFNVAFERKNIISKNNDSFYEILGGFFEFYENFNFDELIISPYTARSIAKSLFKDVDNVPDEFILYKFNVANNITKPFNVTAVCVQSLLMLNDNCAWRVGDKRKFVEKFKNAARSFRQHNKRSFLQAIGIN